MGPEAAALTAFKAPLYIAWEVTHRCNAQCLHCYSNSGPSSCTDGDLSTEEAISVIDQLADAGLLVLAISGGEPLLRRDWRVLVEHAVARGLSVNVGTNGSSITPRTASELEQLGVRSVTVSLDSHLAATHDHFRQFPGLYDKATHAIQLLVERAVRVVVGFTPTRLNWTHGPGLIELSRRLGADAVNLSEYVPAGRGPCTLALDPPQLRQLLGDWIALRDRYRGRIDLIWHDCRVGMLVNDDERRNYVGCGAGRLVGRILPDGTMTPCVFLPTPIGSFREKTFTQMWTESSLLRRFRDRGANVGGQCQSCEHLKSCGGCRAAAYAYSGGDPFAGDPYCWIKGYATSGFAGLAAGESLPV